PYAPVSETAAFTFVLHATAPTAIYTLSLHDALPIYRRIMQVPMDEDEVGEESEVERSINVWRQSERKIMIETVQDLIQTSHKYAKSQYTPSAQRVRWTKLAGQLIGYKDQILKNVSLEAMTIELQALTRRVRESEERRERENRSRNY